LILWRNDIVSYFKFVSLKAKVWGVAYKLTANSIEETKNRLDEREKRYETTLELPFYYRNEEQGKASISSVMVYSASLTGPLFLGEAPADEMARQILTARGPSGDNLDYLIKLWKFMEDEARVEDHHVLNLVQLCQQYND
jgi:cation transport regulator ChaC